jgi:hypothetical protein
MKRFITDAEHHNDISINVSEISVCFYLQNDIRLENHRKHLIEEGFIEDSGETINPFYWFFKARWNDDMKQHLLKKSWVRQKMLDYIEEEINKLKNK